MATEIKLPILGENVDSGVVVNVLVSEGDEVAEGQPVIELETEKATVEVPASSSGCCLAVRVAVWPIGCPGATTTRCAAT